VNYNVGCLSIGREEINGVVVTADDGDVGVAFCENFGDAAEEGGDMPVRVSGGYGVED
jgi:hypothetical protein